MFAGNSAGQAKSKPYEVKIIGCSYKLCYSKPAEQGDSYADNFGDITMYMRTISWSSGHA